MPWRPKPVTNFAEHNPFVYPTLNLAIGRTPRLRLAVSATALYPRYAEAPLTEALTKWQASSGLTMLIWKTLA